MAARRSHRAEGRGGVEGVGGLLAVVGRRLDVVDGAAGRPGRRRRRQAGLRVSFRVP